MIREVEVRNYQSLRHLTVRLGRFTVLTGPSSTGKSSFLRAVRLLAFNARGSSFITRGEKQCSVSMSGDEIELTGMDDDYWQVSVQRGSRDQYLLSTVVPHVRQETYTKLAGKVPEQVTQALRLGEVNFAGQFDPPYLLDASGGEVARVLGRLTNVTLLYKAAQEANRRRLQAASELKTRQADVAQLTEQAQQYGALPAEAEAVRQAEEAVARMQELSRHRSRLSSLTDSYISAANSLERVTPVLVELPSLGRLEELHASRQRLAALLSSAQDAMGAVDVLTARENDLDVVLNRETMALEQYQAQWGTCPLCGNPILKEHSHD